MTFEHPRLTEARAAVARLIAGERVDAVEAQTLDCKEDLTRRNPTDGRLRPGRPQDDDAARYYADECACMSNGEGGAILIGLDDKSGGPGALIGTGLSASWLVKRIHELTNPALTVTAHEISEGGVRLLALIVPRNDGNVPTAARVSKRGSRTARRIGTNCEEMDFTAQVAWVQSRQGYDWSAQASGQRVVEARPQAIEALRDFLREAPEPERQALVALSDVDLISRLQLVHDDGTLNRAGALLLCAAGEPNLKYLARPAPDTPASTRLEPTGRGLAEDLQRVLEAIEVHNPIFPVEGQRLAIGTVRALPPLAVREALVNAVMHRDWDVAAPVDLEQVGSELVVFSPGPFCGGVTEDSVLTTPSKTRNPRLAGVLRSLRIAERESIGVQRMYVSMIRLGHTPPRFRQRDGGVRVALVGGPPVPEVLALHLALPRELEESARFAVALHLLRERTSITAEELARAAQDEPERARATLDEAVRLEVLQRTANPRPGGDPAWRLTDAQRDALATTLPYYSRPTEESIQLIRQLARQLGRIRNRDVQDHLGVGDVRASALLKRTAEEGYIQLGPGARPIGRGTFYVPTERG